ncbi:MAG: HAMP domain-containing histidine kinase [Bacteroidetes bacterium]|nr:HAMP domain-containing histidine kinase [Bacteroidota bacterium]
MKTKIIFYSVSIYIFAAFVWWGYSLVNLRILEVNNETKAVYKEAENVKHRLTDLVFKYSQQVTSQKIDSIFKIINHQNKFDLIILPINKAITKSDELDQFVVIKPQQRILKNLDIYLQKKLVQYIGEGVVFMLLLIWGMVLIYRNVQAKIKLNQQQNNFIIGVTHELKTPVAGIKLMLETLQRRSLSEELKKEMVAGAISDVERLEGLVENVLITSRIDNFKYEFHNEEIDLESLFKEMVAKFQRLDKKSQKFELKIAGSTKIFADQFAITTVFDNLLSNAVKYSPNQACIRLEVENLVSKIRVSVFDEGAIIPESEKDKIFKKFYRIGNEETRSVKGTGLGLYIVKQILNDQNATIEIKNGSKVVGNIFIIDFIMSN